MFLNADSPQSDQAQQSKTFCILARVLTERGGWKLGEHAEKAWGTVNEVLRCFSTNMLDESPEVNLKK